LPLGFLIATLGTDCGTFLQMVKVYGTSESSAPERESVNVNRQVMIGVQATHWLVLGCVQGMFESAILTSSLRSRVIMSESGGVLLQKLGVGAAKSSSRGVRRIG
jgi:hypothetical protein